MGIDARERVLCLRVDTSKGMERKVHLVVGITGGRGREYYLFREVVANLT